MMKSAVRSPFLLYQAPSLKFEQSMEPNNNNSGWAGGHSKNRDAEQGIRPHSAGLSTRNRPPILCLLPKGRPSWLLSSDPETPHHYKGALPHNVLSDVWGRLAEWSDHPLGQPAPHVRAFVSGSNPDLSQGEYLLKFNAARCSNGSNGTSANRPHTLKLGYPCERPHFLLP